MNTRLITSILSHLFQEITNLSPKQFNHAQLTGLIERKVHLVQLSQGPEPSHL